MSLIRNVQPSVKRQKLIDEVNHSPIKVGDNVGIRLKDLDSNPRNPEQVISRVVVSVDGDILMVKDLEYTNRDSTPVHKDKVVLRDIYEVGANPFYNWFSDVRNVNYSLESIIFNLDVLGRDDLQKFSRKGVFYEHLNWNPFVYDKDGNKQYYQRPFVWTLEDKQLLIESIYQDIECGKLLVRRRSFKELDAMVDAGETEVGFHDIVDGKQRLNAFKGFVLDEYPDSHGNYFSDLSPSAQQCLGRNQLFGYAELPENCLDLAVIQQFLKTNFAGVPQSKEHIAYVKAILTKM
jgi:hypothetical protein